MAAAKAARNSGLADGGELLGRGAGPGRGEQEVLGLAVGVAEVEAEEEAVALAVGQGEGARRVEGVLGGDDHEGPGERVADAVGRDLAFLHGLEEGGLGLGRGPVELVGQEDVGEDGPGPEGEKARVAVEDDGPGDIGGEEVGGELDPAEAEPEGAGQGLGQGGLAHAGVVLHQEVALGHEAAEREPDGEVLRPR